MLKTLIVLPSGEELFSGSGTINSVRAAAVTECVNSEQELTIGSVCSVMLEATIFAPNGNFVLNSGDEVTLYKVDDSGKRTKVGLFTAEKPTRKSANIFHLTAFDRIARLDVDLTEWLSSLNEWPYNLKTFAGMICTKCGLALLDTPLVNADYQVQKFSAEGITGRRLMEWIGQISAKFCRATVDGNIELAWYRKRYDLSIAASASETAGAGYNALFSSGNLTIKSSAISVSDKGNGSISVSGLRVSGYDGNGSVDIVVDDGTRKAIPYYGGSLSFEEYSTDKIERVQVRLTEDDVGAAYPQISGEANTYIVSGNYLLTSASEAPLMTVAKNLYAALHEATYTPCKVSVQAGSGIKNGDVLSISDKNGKMLSAYVMTKKLSGQRETIECVGSKSRNSSTAVNNETLKSVSGKVLEVRKNVEGLSVRASQIENMVETNYSELKQTADGLSFTVSSVQEQARATSDSVASVKQELQGKATVEQLSEINATAQGLSISVTEIRRDTDRKAEQSDLQEITEHFNFGSDGMTIYNTASGMGIGVSEQRVVFTGGSNASTEIRPNDMQTTNLRVGTRLDLGNFSLFPRSNGNLSFRYTGGS